MKLGSLCTGYGGLDEAAKKIFPNVEVVWTADIDPAAKMVIERRYPGVPILDDISQVDWTEQSPIDILTAGFPCQDVSQAGSRRGLVKGNRTGLWYEVRRAIDILSPKIVILENVRGLFTASTDRGNDIRALGAVLGDLAEAGYDAEWRSVRACDAGLPHVRERVYIVAWQASKCNPV